MMSTSAIKHHCVYSLVLLGVIFGYLLGRISKNTPTAHMSNLPNWVSDGPSALSREFKTGTSHTFPMQQFGKFHVGSAKSHIGNNRNIAITGAWPSETKPLWRNI